MNSMSAESMAAGQVQQRSVDVRLPPTSAEGESMQRRLFDRRKCAVEAVVEHEGQRCRAEVIDLSWAGFHLKMPGSVRAGDSVTITLSVPKLNMPGAIRCVGRAVRTDDKGIGVQIEDGDLNAIARLQNLLAAHHDEAH